MNYNPLKEVIEKLKEKEIYTPKGGNIKPIVFLEDAIKALEDLEVKLWAYCEAGYVSKHVLHQENY